MLDEAGRRAGARLRPVVRRHGGPGARAGPPRSGPEPDPGLHALRRNPRGAGASGPRAQGPSRGARCTRRGSPRPIPSTSPRTCASAHGNPAIHWADDDNGRRCRPSTPTTGSPAIVAPTLVLHGTEDRLVAPGNAEVLAVADPGRRAALAGRRRPPVPLGASRRRRRRGAGLHRPAGTVSEAPRDVRELAERRADARAAKDFAAGRCPPRGDRRGRMDRGRRARRMEPGAGRHHRRLKPARCAHADVPSAAGRTRDRGHQPPLGVRGLARGHRASGRVVPCHTEGRAMRSYVVADVTDADPGAFGDDVEVDRPGAGHRLGRRSQRRAAPLDRAPRRCRPGRLDRSHRRRVGHRSRTRSRIPASGSPDRSASSRTTSASSRRRRGPGDATPSRAT